MGSCHQSNTDCLGDDMFKDLYLDDMWVYHLLALCAMLTNTFFRIQSNKQISRHRLAWDHNVPQNLRGLLEHGVQESLDRDKKVEGPDNVLLEGVIGYTGSIGTTLWYKIEED
jgi:hypothetical protein